MSRIGKKPIIIPTGVEIHIEERAVSIKGPRGQITQEIPEEVLVIKKGNTISVSLKKKLKKKTAVWGLIRSLLQNHITGVSQGFEKKLEIRGTGYKVALEPENTLRLNVGFSHPVMVQIPGDLSISLEKNIITVRGFNKQKVGEFAAKIRKIRPPEPYKGRGIRYLGEKVRMKEGKKAVAATT